MAELLLELFSEEIPARMQARAAEDLKRLVIEGLAEEGLSFARAEAFVTPRRLTLVVDGLPEKQPDRTEERKGPRVGAPDPAIQGFLKSAGLASLDQCEKRMVGKAEFWFAISKRTGSPTAELMPGLVSAAARGLAWPKSMRWADRRTVWVRPLHSVLCLFDGRPVPGALTLGESAMALGAETRGHRFMAPEPFAVAGFADYRNRLRERFVILEQGERRAMIERAAGDLARQAGLRLKHDPGLLDEVTGLVEWPVVLMGTIDAAFMGLPPELLTTTMRAHQRYFALEHADGTLASRFVAVANTETTDAGKAVIAGNERVLRARLSDARFFWDQDRKRPLQDYLPALAQRIFHAKLGTMAQKVSRMVLLAEEIARYVPGARPDLVRRAAELAKADLATGLVGEFPELQGTIGRYYALERREPPEAAEAIREHYSPLGPNDRCPTAPVSVAVALADKVDTLAGFWKIGETPTGSKDPFALRRAGLGVIRLVLENGLRLPLREVFAAAVLGHGSILREEVDRLAAALIAFLADRLKVALREKGVRHDLIDAVFALGGEDDLVRLMARVDALGAFLGSDDGANLLVAYRRASNIVAIESKKDGQGYDSPVRPELFGLPEEAGLFDRLHGAMAAARAALGAEDYVGAMGTLSGLRGPVDAFFDRVTVNADDREQRTNRLRLLSQIRATLDAVADFSRIEG